MTAQQAAEKWGITTRQVQILCKENRIKGATRISRILIIPDSAMKPTNGIHAAYKECSDASTHHV